MFFLFGCGRKKETAQEVGQWLEISFPGQFEVLETKYAMNQWVSSDNTSFRVIVGAKADPEIEFVIYWDRKQKDGGISKEELTAIYQRTLHHPSVARELHTLLLKGGLEKTAVGVDNSMVDIMVFAEPDRAFRTKVFEAVKLALEAWPPAENSMVRLLFMEEKSWGEHFQDIMPRKSVHALPGEQWQADNCIFYMEIDRLAVISIEEIGQKTRANKYAIRFVSYREKAFHLAEAWAAANLEKPYFIHMDIGFELEENKAMPMSLTYRFDFYLKKTINAGEDKKDGFLVVDYNADQNIFGQVTKETPDAF